MFFDHFLRFQSYLARTNSQKAEKSFKLSSLSHFRSEANFAGFILSLQATNPSAAKIYFNSLKAFKYIFIRKTKVFRTSNYESVENLRTKPLFDQGDKRNLEPVYCFRLK
jgi:hypothetical protein